MKKTLLFIQWQVFALIMFFFCINNTMGQNLMLNPTCDEHGTASGSTSDNADAYDMTPNNTILDESGTEIASPYQATWDNDALEDWLEVFYLGAAGSLDEQPGSTGSGTNGTRGVKLYMDTSPNLPGKSSRRLYQKVNGLTIGVNYTFSVDSRSEAMNTPSEVYVLNNEITSEEGINTSGASDSSVDGFMNITNDYDSWVTNTFTFTATTTSVVIYVRSLNSVDGDTEVFYDNFSLVDTASLSVNEFVGSNFKLFPNPSSGIINVESTIGFDAISIHNTMGQEVYYSTSLAKSIDISNLRSGVYFVKLFSNGKSVIKKIIKA